MAPSAGTCSVILYFLLHLYLPVSVASDGPPSRSPGASSYPDSTRASSRIFNSIHDSMRQLGSSVNYESRCAFLAAVPAGVHLYHGTSKVLPPEAGLKWLAFEPEHAMMFSQAAEHWSTAFQEEAWGEGLEDRSDPGGAGSHLRQDQLPDRKAQTVSGKHAHAQMPLGDLLYHEDDPLRPPSGLWAKYKNLDDWGYLHTYTTTRPLRLLYLDGTSAAKTKLGTLDIQDLIILQDRFDFSTDLDDDNTRAAELCRIARDDWGRRIDGFLRMETGFEIIMCELENSHLEARATVATHKTRDTFATYKALAQRFNGIGRGRVTLNYENFLTIHGDDLNDVAKRKTRRADLDMLVLDSEQDVDGDADEPVDWQGVADMVVQRFSAPLKLLSSAEEVWDSKEAFDDEIRRLMLPFVDHRGRHRQAEIDRCTFYFQPGSKSAASSERCAAARAILQISQTICSELLAAAQEDDDTATATKRLSSLMEMLDWSSWRECMPACVGRDVCYVPVWPFSLALDKRRAPKCVDEGGFYAVAVEDLMASAGDHGTVRSEPG